MRPVPCPLPPAWWAPHPPRTLHPSCCTRTQQRGTTRGARRRLQAKEEDAKKAAKRATKAAKKAAKGPVAQALRMAPPPDLLLRAAGKAARAVSGVNNQKQTRVRRGAEQAGWPCSAACTLASAPGCRAVPDPGRCGWWPATGSPSPGPEPTPPLPPVTAGGELHRGSGREAQLRTSGGPARGRMGAPESALPRPGERGHPVLPACRWGGAPGKARGEGPQAQGCGPALRGARPQDVIVKIGRRGMTEQTAKSMNAAWRTREVVKLRIHDDKWVLPPHRALPARATPAHPPRQAALPTIRPPCRSAPAAGARGMLTCPASTCWWG